MKKTVLYLLAGASFLGMATTVNAQGFSIFPGKDVDTSQVVEVQNFDDSARVSQLEEKVRGLTGQVEDLGFQLLQMEEKIRKMQEDTEFRLQEIESGIAAPPASVPQVPQMETGASSAPLIEQPEAAQADGDETEFYQVAYNLILTGDYPQAEQAFGEFVLSYPDSTLIPDASFWLGESMLAQQKYNESAKTFLNAYKAYGDSPKAPEMLLKLGQSLAGLGNHDAACATFEQVSVRYPDASQSVLTVANETMAKLSC